MKIQNIFLLLVLAEISVQKIMFGSIAQKERKLDDSDLETANSYISDM